MITHDIVPCYVLDDPVMAAAYTYCMELPLLTNSNSYLLEYIYNEIFKGVALHDNGSDRTLQRRFLIKDFFVRDRRYLQYSRKIA